MAKTIETKKAEDAALDTKALRRKRSLALGLALGVVVVIFYVLTIVKLGPGILVRPL